MGLPVAEELPLIEFNLNDNAIFDPGANVKSNLAVHLDRGPGLPALFRSGRVAEPAAINES
jgi:hypothetical protein